MIPDMTHPPHGGINGNSMDAMMCPYKPKHVMAIEKQVLSQ